MPHDFATADAAKYVAARHAADLVEEGMRVGLGTGSTAAWLVRCLGARVADGLGLRCVPTSSATARLAAEAGLRVVSLDEAGWLDLTIDGADEVAPDLSLIKGAGAALLQEKIVAAASDRMVVIADAAKRVEVLGASALPVEVVRFGHRVTRGLIEEIVAPMDVAGSEAALRMQGDGPLVTDEGHHVVDLHLGRIGDPRQVARRLVQIPGVVETGLFCDICDLAVIGFEDGRVAVRDGIAGTSSDARVLLDASDPVFAALFRTEP